MPLAPFFWNMQNLQTGLRLSGVSEREGMGEAPINVEVHAPGQRGALQLLIQSKRELQLIKPHMTRVLKTKQKISRDTKRRHNIRAKIVRKTHQLQSYCNKILARANDIDAKKQQLIEDRKQKQQQQNKKRSSSKKKKEDKGIDSGDEDQEEEGESGAKADGGNENGESINYPHVIENILKAVNSVVTHLANEEAILEESLESTDLAQQSARLAGELKRQIESVASLTRSIMGTQFNRDAKTATGRGPPGHIAFSPFTANDPLFERDDVMQVILETNRRNGKV